MPFVGLRGLEKQLVLKRGLLTDIESQERQLAPVVNAVQGIMDRAAEFIPAHSSLVGDLRDAQRLSEVENQLKQVLARLNSIDRGGFEEKEKQLAALNAELADWEKEQRGLLQSQIRG
ncbi:MAG: hypothetical protein ABSA83_22255, partial [Verrucomicrobiota bacterium]